MPRIQTFNTFGDKIDYAEISTNAKSELLIHTKTFADTGTHSHTGDTLWTSTGTPFSFSAPVNSLLIGVEIHADISSSSSSASAQLDLSFEGTNLGTKNLILTTSLLTSSDSFRFPAFVSGDSALIGTTNTSSTEVIGNYFTPLVFLDTITTIQPKIRISDSAQTVTVSNITLTLYYVRNQEVD